MSPVCDYCNQANPHKARICVACGHILGGKCGSSFPSAACFVGRQKEMAALQWQLDQATGGRGNLLLLTGEMGAGKTRLLKEFALLASRPDVQIWWGSCYEGDWCPPYGPWIEALRPTVASIGRELVQRSSGREIWPLLSLFPELQAILPDLAPPAMPSQEQERLRLYDAITQLLSTCSRERPLLLVLDDLHWADPDSLSMLRHVGHFLGRMRVMIVCTYQDTDLAVESSPLLDTLAALKHETDYREITLQGLDPNEVGLYLAQVLGHEPPRALAEALDHETDGNPYYLHELVTHLLEIGELQKVGETLPEELELRGPSIPLGIRQILRQRMARLAGTTRQLLYVVAGCTRGCSLALLQAATDLPENVLLDSLDEAIRAGLLQSVDSIPVIYQLGHAIVRHTLSDEWSPDRRLRLHQTLAQAMERVYEGQEQGHAAELAAQHYAARYLSDAARGLHWAMLAAEEASAMQGPGQEVIYLRMANELAQLGKEDEQETIRAEILRRLTIAEARALLWDAVPGTVEQALTATCSGGDDGLTCSHFLDAVVRALQEGGAPRSIWGPLVDRGIALSGGQRDVLWARLTLLHSCLEPQFSGPVCGGRWLGLDQDAVAILRATGDEEDYVRTLDPFVWRSREETYELARFAQQALRPAAVLGALKVALGDLVYWHGDLHEAITVGHRLLDAGERYGSIPAQAEALAQLAGAHALIGEWALSREIWKRARELIVRLGPAQPLRLREVEIGARLAYVGGGDWEALATAATACAISPEAGISPLGLLAAAITALAHARAGRPQEARALLQWLTPLLEIPEPITHIHTLAVATVAATIWDIAETAYATVYRQRITSLMDAGMTRTVMGPYALAAARMAALERDTIARDGYMAEARHIVDKDQWRPWQAIVDYDEAKARLLADSELERTVALLDRASSVMRSLEMHDWLQRAGKIREQAVNRRASSVQPRGHTHLVRTPVYPDGLTQREVQVLSLVADGKTNQEIADLLVLSVATVQRHVANIYNKIDARNRSDATAYALRHHLNISDRF